MGLDIAIMGATTVDPNGTPMVQVSRPVGDTESDVEPLGEAPMQQCLGVTSAPYPKDDKGYAEAVVATGVGGRDATIIGARDSRTANTVGSIEPGDTILHSTGPNQAAQVQCKEKRRQVSIVTKDDSGEGILLNLDGTEKAVQIMAFGCVFEMTPDGITISNGDASIMLQKGTIVLAGKVLAGGMNPMTGMAFMVGPQSGSPGGPASVPLMPAMGITPAT